MLVQNSNRNKFSRENQAFFRVRNILNVAFIALVISAIAFYFAMPERLQIFYILGFAAVIIKMAEVCLRLSSNNNYRKTNKP